MQTVADTIAEKGGRLEPKDLDDAAREHVDRSQVLFRAYLKPTLVSDTSSPVARATPPSRVSQFEFVNRWDVNAWAILAEQRPVILFHAGIPFSLYELFNALLARNEVMEDLFGTTEAHALPFSPPKFDYSYVKSGSWPGLIPLSSKESRMVKWSHYLQSKPQSEDRRRFAHDAYMVALHFLFCHELGHIDRGHLEFRNRHISSFALHEVSYEEPPSEKTVSFDGAVLQALEIDADMYALSQAIKPYHPKTAAAVLKLIGHQPSLGGRIGGDPQCHRLFLFSIGVLFLAMEYQRAAEKRGIKLFRSLFSAPATHPSSAVRFQNLVFLSDIMLHKAGLDLGAVCDASNQARRDLVEVTKLLGLDSTLIAGLKEPFSNALVSQLRELSPELEECSAATRERYYRDGKPVTEAEGRRNAEDPHRLRGQAIIIYLKDKQVEIPFLEDDSPLTAYLNNSEKWEEAGYFDNALLYARLAVIKEPQGEAARARALAVQERLGKHAAIFDELVQEHGYTSHLADKLTEAIAAQDAKADARQTLERLEAASAMRPLDIPNRLRLADGKMKLRDFLGAAQEYGQVLERSESDSERIHAFVGLGNAGVESGLTDDAVDWFQQALAIDNANTYALRSLGVALVRGNRPEEAIPYFERALAVVRSDAQIWFESAAAHYACQKFDEARERTERAIALAPDVEHYRNALAQINRTPHS